MQPSAKKPKLDLATASKHGGNSAQGPYNVRATSVCAIVTETSDNVCKTELREDELSQADDEELQIQSSLPLYLDHLYGLYIGQGDSSTQSAIGTIDSGSPHSRIGFSPQSCTDCNFNTPNINTSPLDQYAVPLMDSQDQYAVPLLDSQGFISTARTVYTTCMQTPPPTQTELLFSLSSLPNIIPDSLSTESCTTVADSLLPIDTHVSPVVTVRQASPLLFLSPEPSLSRQIPHSKQNESDIANSDGCMLNHITDNTEPGPPTDSKTHVQTSVAEEGRTQTSVAEGGSTQTSVAEGGEACEWKISIHTPNVTSKKRKRSLGHISVGDEYVCPPGTIALKDCTQQHTTVSLFAFVLIGESILVLKF